MFALSRVSRNAVAGAAVCAFAAAFALLPTQAGGRLAPHAAAPPARPDAAAAPLDPVAPARDPFVPRIEEPDDGPPPPRPAAPALPALPNGAATPAAPRLLAVVTGPRPRALIDEQGRARLVGFGDQLAGARITTIDADGVRLDDGRRLTLSVAEGERR